MMNDFFYSWLAQNAALLFFAPFVVAAFIVIAIAYVVLKTGGSYPGVLELDDEDSWRLRDFGSKQEPIMGSVRIFELPKSPFAKNLFDDFDI